MAQRFLTLILLLCSTSVFAGLFDAPGRSNFIPADRAFVFDFQQNQHDLTLNWQVKEGYYLYRKQVSITPAQASVGALQMPAGEWHEDEFYGKSEIYRQRLSVPVTVNQADKGATLTVTYQGCADAGFCYPPETKVVPLSEVKASPTISPLPSGEKHEDTADLPFSALWALLIGIGIAFTP
ncbi:TPA: protein-disulfide reductase DsbD, partial [Enterobacter roggenkampii]|nr:protein-disulfide reductase DsbD [Enterobacter roggenkampii]